MANLDNPANSFDNSNTPSSSSDANTVISNQIPASRPYPPQAENNIGSPDKIDDCQDIVPDLALSNRSTPLPNIPTNAFEIDRIPSSEDLSKEIFQKVFEDHEMTAVSNNNSKCNDPINVQDIEDENTGRVIYSREPLSMIMESNSPVAEIAPTIVINKNEVKQNSVADDAANTNRDDRNTSASEINALKSEIILPSKSKIPHSIHGIKGVSVANRLYLTGLKKSNSMHSPLATPESFYKPVNYNSGLITPRSEMSDFDDSRSKLLYKIHIFDFRS